MTVRPDFGPGYGEEKWQSGGVPPPDPDDLGEREIQEHDQEDREVEYLDPEDNEAHAPGEICERCGAVITAGQDARLRPDGHWIHEVCPAQPGGLPAAGAHPGV
jgi:hypothetical protein